MEKCFRIFLSELYNSTASGSLLVAEDVVRLTVPLAAWKEHGVKGDWVPYLSGATQHAFKFVAQLSPHTDVGKFNGAMVKWMVLDEWFIHSVVAILK